MPSGDAQRTWFPEMVVRLRSKWLEGVSLPTLISLRDELDGMLQRIGTARNIQTPIITCRRCGTTDRAAEPHVSVRALILALGRFGIASKDQTRALEKAWQNTASNTGWTSKQGSPRGSREPAHIDDCGRGGSLARIRRMCKSRSRWTAEA
jgi:hypothetical protein